MSGMNLKLLWMLLLGACAFTKSYKGGEARYEDIVSEKLIEKRLFVRGEQRLSMKVLVGTKELFDLQSGVSPGFEFPYKSSNDQVIVAVSSQNRIPFSSDELKFLLDGERALSVVELTSSFKIQTLYPYAYPFYRVFIVDFLGNSSDSRNFELQSSRGSLGVKLQFRPLSQNLVD